MKKTVIGIIAHVDSGKTTLSEAMLYLSGKIRKVGRVDHGDAFLDTDMIEKYRGITVFSKPAEFEYNYQLRRRLRRAEDPLHGESGPYGCFLRPGHGPHADGLVRGVHRTAAGRD